MDVLQDLSKSVYRGYSDLNQRLTPSMSLGLLAGGLGAYGVYSFGIKPFLSPLRKMPGPAYNPLYGNVREAMVGEAMDSSIGWVKKYGGVVRFYHLLGRERVLVADPEALKYVLVTNEENYARPNANSTLIGSGIFLVYGAEHKRQRLLLNPFFNHASIESYLTVFEDHAHELMRWWQEQLSEDKSAEIDIQQDLMRMAFDVIGETVFGYDFKSLRNPDSAITNAFHYVSTQTGISFTRLIPFYRKLPTASNKKEKESLQVVNDTIYSIINEKRQLLETEEGQKEATKDLLGKMMLAQSEDTGRGFTDLELRDQVMSLLLAGHETTASSLSWFLLLLAQHQDIQDRLRSEVKANLPTPGSPLTWQHLDRMEYLNCVIKEGQRLYPAAPSFYRCAIKDDEINGYFIPAGTWIAFHFGALMRNPAHWPDPEKFDPERFADGKDIDLYHYLPFNTGPHKCLGHQFARIEMKSTLALLLREFRFHVVPGFKFVRKMRVTLKAYPPIRLMVSSA